MKYYFDSPEQIKGDKAYNAHDFSRALIHYKHALNTLNQVAAQRDFKPRTSFYDELAYVLSTVITTQADAIRASIGEDFDDTTLQAQWSEIPGFLSEMMSVYKEIELSEKKETTPEIISMAYKAASNCCEAISDALIDALSEGGAENEDKVLSALRWLKHAINYLEEGLLTVDPSLHIGYLSILERAYKANPMNKSHLEEISSYIEAKTLLQLELAPMQVLEVNSYLLLIAIERQEKERAMMIYRQCQTLMTDSQEIDHESLLVEDIGKLFQKLSALPQKESPVVSCQFSMLLAVAEREMQAVGLKKMECDVDCEEVSSPNGLIPFDTAASNSPLVSLAPSATFFTPFVAVSAELLPQKNHAEVFLKTMKHIAHHYQDSKFLANVLSIIGDFYYHSASLPFKNIPLIAFELYENTLRLDDTHLVAKARLHQLYHVSPANKRMIDEHKHYAKSTPSASAAMAAPTLFNTIIEENILQIETLLLTGADKMGAFLDRLVEYVAKNIVEKRIAGSKSKLIADELLSQYREKGSAQPMEGMVLGRS